MRKLSKSKIKKILEEHELWLKTDGKKGKRASFVYTDLSGVDFRSCDLRKARFEDSDLSHANFRNANLCDAAIFACDMTSVDFRGTNLTNNNFCSTDMDGMLYDETTIPAMICPKEGSFIGFKKAYGIRSSDKEYIVELRIPEEAKRSSATGNKCRCNKAEVLSITELDGTETDVTEVCSKCDPSFLYRLGESVEVFYFDECRWKECAPGIHFFMNREDAVNY